MPQRVTPSLDDLIQRILDREGGVVQNKGEGYITRFGQTPGFLEQFGLPVPTDRVSAAANYVKWINLTGFHPLVDAGDDLADILLDIAVMSGHQKAIKALQAVLKIPVDGALGPVTLLAIASCDRRQMAREVIAWDIAFQGRIITLNPTAKAQYAAGWANRIAEHVRRLS